MQTRGDMTGSFLESGTLTQFEPLGADGETLFGSALECRAMIQRKLDSNIAGSFALPQWNANRDTLDWYTPEPGPVVLWQDLSDEQRSAVLQHLEVLRAKVADLSRQFLRDDGLGQQSWGRLLEHAVTIPDQSHIFIVGGRPVLAFWGFRLRGIDSNTDVPAGTTPIRRSGGAIPKPGEPTKPEPGDRSGPPSSGSASRRVAAVLRRLWWWLAALVVAVTIAALIWYLRPPAAPQPAAETESPGHPATQEPSAELPLIPLVFPPKAIETPSMSFLTGRWQANSDQLVDSDSRRPIALAYEIDNGGGEVSVTEQTGNVCRAPVAAVFDGNALTLTPRGEIRCPNGPPFYGVTVTCRPNTDRRALCTGSFPNGNAFRVELGKHQ